MWRVGGVLFAFGLLLLSPLDEIFILTPLSMMYGLWVFPLFLIIGLICLVVGAVLIGKHILPLLGNPIVVMMIGLTILITIYICYVNGWLSF